MLSGLDCDIIRALIKKNVNCMVKTTIRTHEKKLKELTRNVVLPFTPAETVLILSGTRLTDDELEIIKEFNFCKVFLYRCYVDDIICLFNCDVDAMKFFNYLNSRHPNIKFTFEKQNAGKLAFFDIVISNESDNYCTSVCCKKTSIGLYTNFTSFTPFSYKIGLIKTLLHRAFEISSSWNFFDQEKRKIKNLLMKNLYPSHLIDKEIKTFLENKLTTKENTNIDHNNKSVSYYKLPYIGSYSNSTKKKKKL